MLLRALFVTAPLWGASLPAGSGTFMYYSPQRYATLRYATLRYATLRYITFRYITLIII